MDILDIFSWVREKELNISEIERIILNYYDGKTDEVGFRVESELPNQANENIIDATNELISEGKRVCYLLRDNEIIAVIGYKEK